jgi:hypothetical protein
MIATQVRRDRTRKTGSLGRIERQRAEIGPFDWSKANLLQEVDLTFEAAHYYHAPIPPLQQIWVVIIGSNGPWNCEMPASEQDAMSRHLLFYQTEESDEYICISRPVASHRSLEHLRPLASVMAEMAEPAPSLPKL